MAKTSKKALGATMAGVMALGAVAGAVNAVDQVKVANAAESQAYKDAKAKIQHTINSINKNYARLENQAQWEEYTKEAKALIAKMPAAEKAQADALTKQVNGLNDTIMAIARINHVEKSYRDNAHIIKNTIQWRDYLNKAKEDMKSVDQTVFAAKYEELVKRYNVASDNVKKIEDEYAKELAAATKLFDAAKETMILEDAKKALVAAEALGSHPTSDELESKAKALVTQIEKLDITVRTISVDAKTYDDNTKGQRLSVKVNGEAMNIDFLKAAGYEIIFNADATILEGGTSNKTGKLIDNLTEGDYKVSVTAKKGGSIVISDRVEVKVRNLDSTATQISKTELTLGTAVLNSNKLVVGDNAQFTDVEVKTGSATTDVANNITVESSNEGVISVGSNKTLIAQAPGTATITVSYGNVKKEISLTVVGEKRKVASVTPVNNSTATIISGKNAKVKVKVLDQYGDPITSANLTTGKAVDSTNTLAVVYPTDIISEPTAVATPDKNGELELSIDAKAAEAGYGTILFKNESGNVLGRIAVSTTKVDNVANYKLEVEKVSGSSSDLTINRSEAKDNKVVLKLNRYTSQGVANGSADITLGNVVHSDDLNVSVDEHKDEITVETKDYTKAGNYDIVVNYDNKVYRATVTVSVTSGITINNVSWTNYVPYHNGTVSATDVLNLRATSVEPILESVTLSASSPHKVRVIDEGVNAGDIFLDKNDNGLFDLNIDEKLGELKVKATNNSMLTGVTNAFDKATIKSENKGTIIYYVNVEGKENSKIFDKMISSTSITVK